VNSGSIPPHSVVPVTSTFLNDTTLSDGSKREDICLSVEDKLTIAHRLAAFVLYYIECGWPGPIQRMRISSPVPIG